LLDVVVDFLDWCEPMSDGLQLDPYSVLGLSRGASADQVRESFHRKSKKHHPDLGGDEWAFRVVLWAYTQLGAGEAPPASIRLFRVSEVEQELGDVSEPKESPSGPVGVVSAPPTGVKDWAADSERVRPGIHDRDFERERTVLVEVLWMRYEVEDVKELLRRAPNSDRNVSGSLHLQWPDPEVAGQALSLPDSRSIIGELSTLYHWLRARPDVVSARWKTDHGRFDAWLTYPSGSAAWSVFKVLHPAINGAGLGVRQWTRDLTIPRESSSTY
jgi:DnaJ domain